MTEGEARDPAPDPQDPDRLITDFAERVPGVLRAAVVASDGVLVAVSDRTQPDQLEQLSAVTAGLISLASAAAQIFHGGAVTQALVTLAPRPGNLRAAPRWDAWRPNKSTAAPSSPPPLPPSIRSRTR